MRCWGAGAIAPNKVVPDFDSPREYLGPLGFTQTLKNARGVELFAYFWPAKPGVPLRGIVQLAHGNATYLCFDYLKFQATGQPNLYDGSWVEALNAAGYAVCGIDHEGFGRSKGMRSFIRRFQHHVDNLLLFQDHVASQQHASFPVGRLPYFLLAHSMGGLAATMAAVQQPARFSGLVLVAPMLSLQHRIADAGSMRKVLQLLSVLAPKLEVGASSSVRHVPWIYDAWDADPYVYDGGMRARNAEEFFKATEALGGVMHRVALPLLLFQSERDTHVEPQGAVELYHRAATNDKTLRMLVRPWHVLSKEEGNEELLAEALSWLAARSGGGGTGPGAGVGVGIGGQAGGQQQPQQGYDGAAQDKSQSYPNGPAHPNRLGGLGSVHSSAQLQQQQEEAGSGAAEPGNGMAGAGGMRGSRDGQLSPLEAGRSRRAMACSSNGSSRGGAAGPLPLPPGHPLASPLQQPPSRGASSNGGGMHPHQHLGSLSVVAGGPQALAALQRPEARAGSGALQPLPPLSRAPLPPLPSHLGSGEPGAPLPMPHPMPMQPAVPHPRWASGEGSGGGAHDAGEALRQRPLAARGKREPLPPLGALPALQARPEVAAYG